MDYRQYSLNLDEANKKGQFNWKNTYNFSTQYKVGAPNGINAGKLRDEFKENNELFNQYRKHLNGGLGKSVNDGLICDTYDWHEDNYGCNNRTRKSDKMNYILQ